jgi:lysozyme
MKLIKNARRVALRSHSMWAGYLGLAVLVAPEVLYAALGYDVASPRLWWGMGVLLVTYGLLGRVKDQGIGDRP